jgi:hypothetical protein
MAAFEGDGFAAVDAFFGKSSTPSTSRKDAAAASELLQAQTEATQQGPKRLGLGADAGAREVKDSKAVSASNPLTKRLLQVGTKRKLSQKRDADDYDDDNDDEQADKDKDDDEDGDEEGGRTAIEERAPTAVPVSAAILAKEAAESKAASKKKKKGKKERQKEGADVAEGAPKDESHEATEESPDNGAPKRKRTKIRSRQKNIYKDTRAEKPSHLIPGKHNYQGRPMTLETRKRLNLPLEKEPSAMESWSSNWNDDQSKDAAVDTMPLAVDAVTEEQQPSEKKEKKKKAKKSRFKNLR